MSDNTTNDIAVVGNGVLGWSIAYELSKRSDLRVAVIGPAPRHGAASRAAGAMLNTFGEITRHTLSSDAGRAKFEVSRTALDRWPEWLAEIKDASGESDLDATYSAGTTMILNSKSGFLDNENFKALERALHEYGEPYQEIDPRDIPGLTPLPDARPLRAIHLDREGAIDARRFLDGIERAAVRAGVDYVDAEVTGFERVGERIHGVHCSNGAQVSADTTVLSAGAFSGALLAELFPLGQLPIMVSGRGIAFTTTRTETDRFETVVRTPTRAGNCGLHMVPYGDGREYYGATNIPQIDPTLQADLGMSEFLVRVAREQLDQRLFFADIEWRVGNRPMSLDGFPMFGRTSMDGLVVATGTYRDGFHCSPVVAQYVADDILGQTPLNERLPLFNPQRAPIETTTPREAVDLLVDTAVSGAWEVGVALPGWHIGEEPFEAHYTRAMNRFYDLLKAPVALLPEILLSVIFDPELADHRVTQYLNARATDG